MLALVPGLIAGTALTTSINQVPNVGTQASVATCTFVAHLSGGGWNTFGACMAGMWGVVAMRGALSVRARTAMELVRALVTFVRVNPWGLAVAVA